MPWRIYSVFVLFLCLFGLIAAKHSFPTRIKNDGKKSPTMTNTSNIKFDFDPMSGLGPMDSDDEDLAGSGSGLSGSGDGTNEETELKPTPTPVSTSGNTTTTSRPKSPCEIAYQAHKILVGHHVPQCLPNGDYAPLQCNGLPKLSSCFCSDFAGKAIPHTQMEPPNFPDCENGENLNPCVFQVVKSFRSKLLGAFYPKCSSEGQFERKQCHENICFCVNPETGAKINGTETKFPDLPLCKEDVDTEQEITATTTTAEPDDTEKIIDMDLERKNDDTDIEDEVDEKETINIDTSDNTDSKGKDDKIDEVNNVDTSQEVILKKPSSETRVEKATSSEIMTQPGILAGIIGGSVVVLLCLVLLIMFLVYRMRKKDEGSYPLDEPRKTPNYSYVRAPEKEFYA